MPALPARLPLLFHILMALWFLASVTVGLREAAMAPEGGAPVTATMLGTGLSLGALLLIWFAGGLLFRLLAAARQRRAR